MKKETFEKARSIQAEIDSLKWAIENIDMPNGKCSPPPVNVRMPLSILEDNLLEGRMNKKIRIEAVKVFKTELAKLQKEFDNLK